jgi:alanine dehydrogenase
MTYHDDPIYTVDGIIHYCVGNMPGAVPRTATIGLNAATLPFGLAIANKGFAQAIQTDPFLASGVNTYQGKITLQTIATLFNLPYQSILDLL